SISSSQCAFIFFFQAEDGIRVFHVTGVQTCALPISICSFSKPSAHIPRINPNRLKVIEVSTRNRSIQNGCSTWTGTNRFAVSRKIGRAAGRERVENTEAAGADDENGMRVVADACAVE